jgi:hypothetical protein
MCQSRLGDAEIALPTRRRIDRRVVLKAAAALGVMSAGGVALRRPARAQPAPETRAATWVQAENVGGLSADGSGMLAFRSDFPFYAVGVHWAGEVGTWPTIELSFSLDGATFTDPLYVNAQEVDAGRPDRDGRIYTDLAFAEGGAAFVQYRVLDPAGTPTAVPGLALNTGYSGHGIMGSAGGARLTVDALLGRLPAAQNPFRPDREMTARPLDVL